MRDRLALFLGALFPGHSSASPQRSNTSVRWSKPLRARVSRKPSKALNREAIAFHYDVSNEFYGLWLDEQMVYSCAYFNDPGESLEQAQRNKLDHICRKLRLTAGERLLDIGSGWGALICWAAQHYGARAHGIALSRRQYEYTQEKIRGLGMERQVTVELRDYRDLPKEATFDKVSSVGMCEHVGLKNLPTYFRAVEQVLKPGGSFSITGSPATKRAGENLLVPNSFSVTSFLMRNSIPSVTFNASWNRPASRSVMSRHCARTTR